MRLSILDHGHRRRAKVFLTMTSAMSRVDSPDIVKMLLYRPGFLTRPLLDLAAEAMRGPSYWTAGEREYLAMTTAQLHQCPFCVDSHAELTRIAGNGEIDPADPSSARPELLAVRAFLDDLAVSPDLPPQALADALRVNLVWNIVNRLANAFGFVLRDGQLHSGTRALHRFGYRFPGFLLAGGEATDPRDPVGSIRHNVLAGPGVTDPSLRFAAASGSSAPASWDAYVGLVRDASYRVSDDDVLSLAVAGHSEDEIFEVTVAAAVGAALRSFDAGSEAIRRLE